MSQGQETIEQASVEAGEYFPEFLRPLKAVVVAVFANDGALLDANDGFLDLLKGNKLSTDWADVRSLIVNPRFNQLIDRQSRQSGGVAYQGKFKLRGVKTGTNSLVGRVYRRHHALLLVAEYDFQSVRRLRKATAELNEPLAEGELLRLHRQAVDAGRRGRARERVDESPWEGADKETARVGGTRTSRRMKGLTPREKEVLQRLVLGSTNKVIARALNISERTVESHRANIMRKMRARSLAELVRLSLQR